MTFFKLLTLALLGSSLTSEVIGYYDLRIDTCKFGNTILTRKSCGANPFMSVAEKLFSSDAVISESCNRLGTSRIPDHKSFDFIVVGAGVAGSVLAGRLSKNHPDSRILLIEAGPEEPSISAVPGLFSHTWRSDLDWQYTTEPTEGNATACLNTGGKCRWSRGKMVGGTGVMNGMMYMRGHPEIFNQWEKLGNPGWSYADVEKYFKRAEDPVDAELTRFTIYNDNDINNGNPLKVGHFPHFPEFGSEILKAAEELNYKTKDLYPSKDPGVIKAPVLVHQGIRGTTSRYYLRSAKKNGNLYLLTNAMVTKILTKNKVAFGVEVIDSKNRRQKFKARQEVILSAGAIGSPQILLLSGIGPKEDLEKLKIPVVQDLPEVGKNLQNHISVGVDFTIKDTDYKNFTIKTLNEYIQNRTGPLSSTGITQLSAFFTTNLTENEIPDIQSFFDGFGTSFMCVNTGLDNECTDGKVGNCSDRRDIGARATAVTTRSKGYLKLNSKDPHDHPLMYPNYLTDERDMKILIDGIRKVQAFVNTPTMKKWDMRLTETIVPGCENITFNTDEYWKCVIRRDTGPENHQVGTCSMGPAEFPQKSVVDPQLQVHNVKNLRVVDASVMPIITNANTMGPVIMIAEKAADMINDKYRVRNHYQHHDRHHHSISYHY